jgi:homoserine O-acetyltransferase
MVNPGPALKFAQLLHAPTVLLPGESGHLAILCQKDTLYSAVSRFFDEQLHCGVPRYAGE